MDKAAPKADQFKANLDRAAPLLAKLKADGIAHMIGGEIVPSISGATFETRSPVDNAVLASVARGSAEDVDRAATAAAEAFPAWRDMSASMRRKLLHRVADAIVDRAEDIALLECIDTGQAYRFMAKAAIRAAENFRFFADKCADARDGLNTPSEEHWNISTRVPIGPVGVITPWNTPFMLSTWKIAPALAAGCTVVHKPAEWSPVTADLLAKLVKQAGIPDGVLNTVHGLGEEAGKALTEHPAIKAIAQLANNQVPDTNGVTIEDPMTHKQVPAILATPIAVTIKNVAQPINDQYTPKNTVCTGKYVALCTKNGVK